MKAIERINSEMQKNPDDRYTEIVGQYVIDRCAVPEDEKKVTEDKTLKGAMDAVYALAKKMKRGSTAVLTPGEVFGEVDRYFGFSTDEAAQWRAVGMTAPAAKAAVRPADAPTHGGAGRMELDFESLFD